METSVSNLTMALKVMIWAMHALDVMFFTGLAGCVAVVIVRWVAILKQGFTGSDKE